MGRSEQGRASEQIGLGWGDQSKENKGRAECVDKREVRKLDWIGLDQSKHIGARGSDQTEQSG